MIAGKAIDAAQGRLALAGVTGEVRRLFDIAAFSDLFVICATQQEGITNVKGAGAA